MWCENCQADRAAEANAETQQVNCATCGAQLMSKQLGKFDRQLQQARELLERWSKEPLLEPYSPLPDKHASHLSELRDSDNTQDEPPAGSKSPFDLTDEKSDVDFTAMNDEFEKLFGKPPSAKFRYDFAHGSSQAEQSEVPSNAESPNPDAPTPVTVQADSAPPIAPPEFDRVVESSEEEQPIEPVAEVAQPEPEVQTVYKNARSKVHRTDPAPQQVAPATHLNIQQLIEERLEQKKKKIDWVMMAGQWLAYLGVLAMTAGGAVIVFGYFGGAENMTPRGWMLTTAGQMLLFLGIVTLISNGMERSSEEITDRIEILGEQLIRFESETRAHFVKEPKLLAAAYADDVEAEASATVQEESRESV